MRNMTMTENKTLTVNGRTATINGERNLLELIRKIGIDIPTFCYHSELSIYGACRLCLVEVEGRGIMASCSTEPEPGMVIRTDTKEIREMRKINVELLLANHKRECPSCVRSSNCALQDLGRRLGVEDIRFKQRQDFVPLDTSSASLTRDPNKCVLCGDCVRVCREVQGIGAIDFVKRGAQACVAPAFEKNLSEVECVNCGQCAAVCPTGAIIPKQNRDQVWNAIYDKSKTVVAQIAPAVRVALGEYFGMEPGVNVAGKIVNALKLMGIDYVYDTCFTADMTIFEEATEFMHRLENTGSALPLITSCCPAWVKFAEIYFPELLPNLSSCKSPQQMFGAVAKKMLPEQLGIKRKDLIVVSIMPCTAKKTEATLPRYSKNGNPDVDFVLTTTEIGRMINSMGIMFNELEPEAFDLPLGFSTGAGVIFGTTGGVMEAALRYAVEKLEGTKLKQVDFKAVRGTEKIREAKLDVAGTKVKVAVVHGLAAARELMNKITRRKAGYHFIEVMACPDGCIAGAGQPRQSNTAIRRKRGIGLYQDDKRHQLQKPQDNYLVDRCYGDILGGEPGSHEAHNKLHTRYMNRSQMFDARIPVLQADTANALPVTVTICARQPDCPGQVLLGMIAEYIKKNGWEGKVQVDATFSSREMQDGTICVTVGDQVLGRCEFRNAVNTEEELSNTIAFGQIRQAIEKGMK